MSQPDDLDPQPGKDQPVALSRRVRPLETVTHSLLELSAILENATVGILFTRNRKVARSNPLCSQMFGYAAKDFIGLSGFDLYPSVEEFEAAAAEVVPALASGQPFHEERRMKRQDGSLFWCRISAKAVDPLHPQGGTIWIMENIEEDRAVRAALAQKTTEQEATFQTSILGISVVRERQLVRCNRRFEELFGCEPGEMIGHTTRQWYVSDADFAAVGAAYDELRAGRGHQREQLLRRKDGSVFWGRLSGRAFEPERPEAGCVWMLEDTTAQRQAEENIHRALAEQEMIFDNAAVGIMYVRNNTVQRCNRKQAEIFGYDRSELAGQSVRIFFRNDRDYLENSVGAYDVINRGEIFVAESRVVRKDGGEFWVRATGHRADQEDNFSVVWIFEDVTERQLVQQELVQARDELEQRVIERTAELAATNAQLQAEIFERMQGEQRIWHLAHHDALTSLPNRALMLDRLDQALMQGDRYVHKVAVMFLDLDRFKSINDTLGHALGDELLIKVTERLRESVRAIDTVSRLGGDEFVIVLQEVRGPEDAMLVAEKIISGLAPPIFIDGHELHVTASLGIAIFPDDGAESVVLMKNADTAMYHAKACGRNNFQFFAAQMNIEASRFFTLEQQLRSAIDAHQLLLHYQPLIDLEHRQVCGMEALLRWQDPELGMISPADFIPVAEEAGLIVPIGEWVLRQALRQNREWQQQGYPAIPISINLSPRQFRQKNLVEMVRSALIESDQPASLLELEITESTLMRDADETLGKLRSLAVMGVRLAVDDFGTGYSSLAYLKRFPVHKLKIDQSFVRDLTKDNDDVMIVTAIIQLARSLGPETLAEGVETDAQLGKLINLGCLNFQGYYFSRPQPPVHADELFNPGILRQSRKQAG